MTPVAGPLLRVDGLTVAHRADRSRTVVDDVSFTLGRGEALGIAGESGCGKTTTALSLLGLLPRGLRRSAGEVTLDGRRGPQRLDLLPGRDLRDVRWSSISMVFQGALNALNPVRTIGWQIGEAIRLHRPDLDRRATRARVAELLEQVGVRADRARHYPHEFSGGQRQRVMIALALACDPEVVIADEPTTALDVITQAQVLDLLAQLRRDLGLALLLITHDLSVLAETCDRVAVMYAGQVVEHGRVEEVYRSPEHPYTQRLLDLLDAEGEIGRLPEAIPGAAPDPADPPGGCRFHPRCHRAEPECASRVPDLRDLGGGRVARCLLAPWADRPRTGPR